VTSSSSRWRDPKSDFGTVLIDAVQRDRAEEFTGDVVSYREASHVIGPGANLEVGPFTSFVDIRVGARHRVLADEWILAGQSDRREVLGPHQPQDAPGRIEQWIWHRQRHFTTLGVSSGRREDGFVDEISHRRLLPEDAGEVLTLQRAAFLAEAQLYATTNIPPLLESFNEIRREIEATYSLGAFRAARLVGAIRLTVDGSVGWISRVAVAPDQQGQGIASDLLRAVEQDAPSTVREFRLVAGFKSEENRAMYERRGYREISRTVDSADIELVVMGKPRS
jgi:GNAT superfamily N-acetyltransferase